jgi:4'-phosphopantetheinyl transferase
MSPQTPERGDPVRAEQDGAAGDMRREEWEPRPEAPRLGDDEIHLWRVRLDQPAEVYSACLYTLTADERERAGRFHFDRHRRQFVISRGALRSVLGHYLDRPPSRLRFVYSSFGKPAVEGEEGPECLRFNLSHAEGMALIALTRGKEVGVDVEVVREEFPGMEIAQDYFSAREVRTLRSLPEEARAAAFFLYWTRKEAYIKAIGEGLSHSLQQFSVSLGDGESSVLAEPEGVAPGASTWTVKGLSVGESHAAAVAFRGPVTNFRFWQWDAALLDKRTAFVSRPAS